MTQEEELTQALAWVRSRAYEACTFIDAALSAKNKREKRLSLLKAGGEMDGAVKVIEQLLKTEPRA